MYSILIGKPEMKRQYGDLGLDGRMLIELILKKLYLMCRLDSPCPMDRVNCGNKLSGSKETANFLTS